MHQPADLHFLNCFKLLDLYINLGRYAHTLHAVDTADSDLIRPGSALSHGSF